MKKFCPIVRLDLDITILFKRRSINIAGILRGAQRKFYRWDPAKQTVKAQKEWSKSGGMFPEMINGKYLMLFGDSNIWFAQSENGIHWKAIDKPFLNPRKGKFDSVHVEMGPPPIRTEKGWLVLYHGIDEKIVYRIGYALLDLKNPQKILKRSDMPIFQPHEPYELSGIVDILPGGLKRLQTMDQEELNAFLHEAEVKGFMPQVTFCNGAVLVGDTLRIYYGASDSVICTATANLNDILAITTI